MAHGEFKTVYKSFEGYFNVSVENTWDNFGEVHDWGFIGCLSYGIDIIFSEIELQRIGGLEVI